MSALRDARDYAESAVRAEQRGEDSGHVTRLAACATAFALVAVAEQLDRLAYQSTKAQR